MTRLDTSAGDACMEAAEAKRARKAAKRRRDAERTAAGQTLGRMIVASRTLTRDVQAFVRKLRAWREQWPVGEVQP